MDYKQILEDVLEIDKKFVVVAGIADVVADNSFPIKMYKDLKSDNFWRIIGRGDDEHIIEALSEFGIGNLDCDGEYEFKAVLRWTPSEYDDYGRCTMRSYLEVEYVEFNLIQTFQQREREFKLNEILTNEFDNLFKLD